MGSIVSGGWAMSSSSSGAPAKGEVADSWVSAGDNNAIPPGDLGTVLISEQIAFLSEGTGLNREEPLQSLSQHLPRGGRQDDSAGPAALAAEHRAHLNGDRHDLPLDHPDRLCGRHRCSPAGFGPHRPSGFLLTTALGIAGAFIGQTVGWYRPDQGAGFIGAIVGAIVVLFIWNPIAAARRRPI
jgi:uncharacterized membrane protein YeaQ/YmgE (transglycosylase-associated protein family)